MSVRDDLLARAQYDGRLPTLVGTAFDLTSTRWTGAVGDGADPAAQYRIGSITKTLTAALVAQCRVEGLLSWEDPIGRHVPETGYGSATVGELLGHLSGMQSEPAGPWWERSAGVDTATLLSANDGSGRVADPGEYFHYTNLGFALLGEAVSRLRGAAWWDLVHDRLLGPLGMTDTTYLPGPRAVAGHSVHHYTGELADEPATDTGAMAPAGQLWSTLADLTTWGRFLVTGHADVLPREVLDEMAEPTSGDYGLGLQWFDHGGLRLVGHLGSMPGFQAGVFVDRIAGTGAAFLTNGTTGVSGFELAGDLHGGTRSTPAVPRTWRPSSRVPVEARQLLGVWFWGHSAYDIRWNDEHLELHDVARGRLFDRFVLARDGRWVGTQGYHRGETLRVFEHHLDCATFIYTRVPYDDRAPIPGRPPGP